MTRAQRAWWSSLSLLVLLLGSFSVLAASQVLPVLLIYGYQPVPGFRTTQLWEEFAEYLSGNNIVNAQTIQVSDDHNFYYLPAADAQHRDVFMSNYALSFEPTVRDIFFYTRRFVDEIDAMDSRFGVGHSVGGLIARTYVEISDFESVLGTDDFGDYGIAYGGEIRTLVLLATPNHGTLVASLGEWFSTMSRQLAPGSEFLKLLNEEHWLDGRLAAFNPSVRYVSMAGQTCLGCGLRLNKDICLRECVEEALAWNGSDLVVMMASAYLPEAENCALIGFDHVKNHTDVIIAAAIKAMLAGKQSPVAIYASGFLEFQPE
ncbi:esterase/lipase family protein [Candidatus Bipolaricaulota bacterium]